MKVKYGRGGRRHRRCRNRGKHFLEVAWHQMLTALQGGNELAKTLATLMLQEVTGTIQ
jgi:hypothetical protein